MFPVVRNSLVFSGFGLKPPASGLQSYSSISLKTSPSIHTGNKTFRLMVKRFSTVRDTQRCSQSYMKKSRGRKETEVSRRRKRGTQEETDRSMQLFVPRVFSVVQTHPQRFTELD